MEQLAILVTLEAKPGKEQEVADFLKSALPLVEAEPGTCKWYAFQISNSLFGIFDTFATEHEREAHLNGPVAKALMARAAELFSTPPKIEMTDLLAVK